jgi:2-haloacid dehalogenase
MTALPIVEPPANRPAGHRGVPLLTEPSLGHYPEFRRFVTDTFGLDADRIGPSGLLRVEDRFYELVLLGRSGQPFPSGVEIHALVPGLEPLDETTADLDIWIILDWLVTGVGGEWRPEALATTGQIYRVPAMAPQTPATAPGPSPRHEALAFDLYGTLVDPLAISTDLERTMPPSAAQLVAATWRRTQIDYAFRLTVMGRYENFARLTERSLEFALREHGQTLSDDERAGLLARYDTLEPFPDTVTALRALTDAGIEMVLLSNGSPAMLNACLDNSGLRAYFPRVISADSVRVFKPHPAVYRYAAEALGRPIDEIRLVSCNSFDIVGAATAGMLTAWINRGAGSFDTIGVQPDVTVRSLADLLGVLETGRITASSPSPREAELR